MPLPAANNDELDLHWINEDPDFGIAASGVYCKNMDDITGRIAEVKDTVKKINLDNQPALTSIPSILGECSRLEELDISHTNIKEIPPFLFLLPNLKIFSCRCSQLYSFPKGLSKAEKLEYLHLRINKGWIIPQEISSVANLKTLILDLYSDAVLPDDLGNLANLEHLSLQIKYDEGAAPGIPSSLNSHHHFRKLCINNLFHRKHKNFDLKYAVQILSSCLALESLELSGLAVEDGHDKISNLTSLKELELRHLLINGNIFDPIVFLDKLEKLSIWGSEFRITEIPDISMNIKELREFSFAGNFVVKLPPSFYSLKNLTAMEIGSTGISMLGENIGDLKGLQKIHVYDNILHKLPNAAFTLPRLKILNIEENIFSPNEIAAIKTKLTVLEKNGQKIQFTYDGQGHRQMVKKLRALKDIAAMDNTLYFRHCLNAVNENPFAIKYADKKKFQGTRYYAELCIAAVRKNCFALEVIDHTILEKSHYFHICIEAARKPDISHAFKLIKDELFTNYEYVQVCLEAALHNNYADFLNNINSKASLARLSRKEYERICWVAVLHYPPAISKMIEPTEELILLAAKRGYDIN